MALVSLARRLQSDRVGTGLVRSAGSGLAAKLKRGMGVSSGPRPGMGSLLRQKLLGQPIERPAIQPVSAFGGGVQAPGVMNPARPMNPEMTPPPAPGMPSMPSAGQPGDMPGGLRARLLSLLQRGQPLMA